jgi:hypothetical protein
MAWTNPKTWITGETLTANDLNVYVKDNTNFLFTSAVISPINLLPGQTKTLVEPIGNGSTAITQLGSAVTASGTATARAVANTNIFTSRSRLAYASGATAGNQAGIRLNSAQLLPRDYQRIRFRFGWGLSQTALTSKRGIFGFWATTSATPNTAFTSTTAFPNIVAFAFDINDTTLKVIHNDASGAPTIIDLGINFPVNTINTDWFSCELIAYPNGTFYYQVYNSSNGAIAFGDILTDVPANTTFLSWNMSIVTTAAAARSVDIGSVSLETQDLAGTWRT